MSAKHQQNQLSVVNVEDEESTTFNSSPKSLDATDSDGNDHPASALEDSKKEDDNKEEDGGGCHGCTYFSLFFCILYGFIQ